MLLILLILLYNTGGGLCPAVDCFTLMMMIENSLKNGYSNSYGLIAEQCYKERWGVEEDLVIKMVED